VKQSVRRTLRQAPVLSNKKVRRDNKEKMKHLIITTTTNDEHQQQQICYRLHSTKHDDINVKRPVAVYYYMLSGANGKLHPPYDLYFPSVLDCNGVIHGTDGSGSRFGRFLCRSNDVL